MSTTLRGATRLPDGTLVRGRGLRDPLPEGPLPDYGLYLVSRPDHPPGPTGPPHPRWSRRRHRGRFEPGWEADWIVWPDFRTPADPHQAARAIVKAFRRAQAGGRVEVGCGGGSGRTGTVLACMAILAGVPATQAVGWVRANYRPRAVETRRQRAWVEWFARQDPHSEAPPGDPTGLS
jgi:Protein-tyrosine phosphatase